MPWQYLSPWHLFCFLFNENSLAINLMIADPVIPSEKNFNLITLADMG